MSTASKPNITLFVPASFRKLRCMCVYYMINIISAVVSKLSNLEDDPSVLALGKLDHQQ